MSVRILYLRSLPLEYDSRSTRMISEYRKRGYHVTAVIWSRGSPPAADEDTVTCSSRGAYGRRWRGLGARMTWLSFLARHLLKCRGDFDLVHAVDLDTAIVGVPLARLLKKPIVYDAFDHIGAIAGQGRFVSILAFVERMVMARAAIKVFPDLIRVNQYGIALDDAVRIIGNIPDIQISGTRPSYCSDTKPLIGPCPLKMVYVGTLESSHRGLEYLPKLCEAFGGDIEIVVAGTGELEELFCKEANRLPNLTYLGRQSYSAALEIMSKGDCLYGPYLLSASAHRYASPNKMYEHLALGKPLITSLGTPPAELVGQLNSGFLFDGTFAGLEALMSSLDRRMCLSAGERAAMAWRAKFAALRERQLEEYFECFEKVATV